jgi:hypothetical protein
MIEVSPNPKSLPKLFTMIAEVSHCPLLSGTFSGSDAKKEPAQAGLQEEECLFHSKVLNSMVYTCLLFSYFFSDLFLSVAQVQTFKIKA